MRFLFDNALAPITSTIGFLEADCAQAVQAYVAWSTPIQARRSVILRQAVVGGSLRNALLSLLPLTSVESRRFLFIPTKSAWTAFFDNGHQGTEAAAPMSYLASLLKCRGIRVVVVPHSIRGKGADVKGRYGAVILEIYGPERENGSNSIRSLAAANDGGKWVFFSGGMPQPFEDPAAYQAKRIRDRFTVDMLARYLQALGISVFDENYYLPQMARLVYKEGPIASRAREFTLGQIQDEY